MRDDSVIPCPDCGHPTMADTAWSEQPKPRAARRRLRGKCRACARREAKVPRVTVQTIVLEEWEHHVPPGPLERPRRHYVQQLAPRMGMTPEALERQLDRAGVRSTWSGSTWQGRAA